MKKAIIQKGKELSLDLFAWQIRFLPMTQAEQRAQVSAQRRGLGLVEGEGALADTLKNKVGGCLKKP
jgi:hypothetical protein